ncbi:unnamed protein product [Phytomonas sp. EM1]|nr:unnamed protein product [Phytomonas sp. EM1]|eukprot:CCW61650.1 unnamed protein product [Phytomonas sp. isolate EM1]
MKFFLFNLLVVLLLLQPFSAKAAKVAKEKYDSDDLPSLSDILAQNFEVSVITQSFGVFNASLRIQSSPYFKGRLYGELIPHGDLLLMTEAGDATGTIPHFSRFREAIDDQLSVLTSSAELSSQMPNERPTLLVFDMEVRTLPSKQRPSIEIRAFYLPEAPSALQEMHEAIQEGTALPVAMAELFFRPTRPAMTSVMLSDIPVFARIASAMLYPPADSSAKTASKGGITINFFSEHEFTIDLRLSKSLLRGGLGAKSESSSDSTGDAGDERVWVHGYAPISARLSPREVPSRPWWVVPSTILIILLTFFLQIITGIHDGKQKAVKQGNPNSAVTAAAKKTN